MIYFTDGFKNKKATGYIIINNSGDLIDYKEFEDIKTNNEAEYEGVLSACKNASTRDTILTDSKLIYGHCVLGWKCNYKHLQKYVNEITELIYTKVLQLRWIPRDKNAAGKVIEDKFSK